MSERQEELVEISELAEELMSASCGTILAVVAGCGCREGCDCRGVF